jgi:cation-transporting ATPase E
VLAFTLEGKLLCFFVIEDHIRETAKDTLAFFAENGVVAKIISGDNPLTVSKIAEQCGVKNADKFISLEGMPLEKIPEIAEEYTIFARVSPEQKEALVTALKANGTRSLTGDGVNDILALRKSDLSITFEKATEAAKSCSDVVLLDNDFSHLKDVVGEGRRVIGNIQRTAVLYLMKAIAVIIFAFALIPFGKAQMWYSSKTLYILEAAVIRTGGFLLSLESKKTPVRGSFIKNINSKAIAAGILAAAAISIPIMMYRFPMYFGAEPLISAGNVRTMMTILMLLAGITVIISMCVPFNKYRMYAVVAVIFIAATLGFMLPTSYIGGLPTSGAMFHFDPSAGETLFDCHWCAEFFQAVVLEDVQNIVSDVDNYKTLHIFMFIAVPLFMFVMNLIDKHLEKGYISFKDDKKVGAGRLLLLISGTALVIEALLSTVDVARMIFEMKEIDMYGYESVIIPIVLVIALINIVLYFIMGVSGYNAWKTGEKKYINRAFIMSLVMGAFLAFQLIIGGLNTFTDESLSARSTISQLSRYT